MPRRKAAEEPPIHNRIAVLRAERGLSRRELADIANVHYQTIGYIERGEYNPSLFLALTLAEYFDISVDAIFSLQPLGTMSSELYPRTTTTDKEAIS